MLKLFKKSASNLKPFNDFSEAEQCSIAVKVTGYIPFLLKEKSPDFKIEDRHLVRVYRWLLGKRIMINTETKMIEQKDTHAMLEAAFGINEVPPKVDFSTQTKSYK